jgi:hypothetical protein
MVFLFRRLEQDSLSSSPRSLRTSSHHSVNMASPSLKIRTPEEAGMFLSMHCSPPPPAGSVLCAVCSLLLSPSCCDPTPRYVRHVTDHLMLQQSLELPTYPAT